MKKYEFTGETKKTMGVTLKRIRALVEIKGLYGVFNPGDLGGWIEKEENLSQEGNAWVYGDAWLGGNARVYGDAQVCGNARVYGDAQVCGITSSAMQPVRDADFTGICQPRIPPDAAILLI